MKRVTPQSFDASTRELLLLLGEELKQPLIAISQLSEIQDTKNPEVYAHAQQALRTIDNVLLYQRIHSGQTALKLEPVHLGSTIHEVVRSMEPLMRTSGCRTELIIQHGLSPVDADRRLLFAGLQSLWQALIATVQNHSEIICRAHRTPQGIRLSLQSSAILLSNLKLSRSKRISAQPITAVAGPATDMIIAQGIFEMLGANLGKTNSKEMTGLGATFRPSRQLQIL